MKEYLFDILFECLKRRFTGTESHKLAVGIIDNMTKYALLSKKTSADEFMLIANSLKEASEEIRRTIISSEPTEKGE